MRRWLTTEAPVAKAKRDRRASIRSMAVEPETLDPRIWEQDGTRESLQPGDEAERVRDDADSE